MCLADSPGFLLMSDATGISYFFTISDTLQPFLVEADLKLTDRVSGNV